MRRIFQKVILWDFMQLLEKKEGMQFLEKVRLVIEEIISKNIRWMLKSLFLLKLRDSKITLKKIAEDHGLEEISCNSCGLRDFEIIARKKGFRTVRCSNCGLCFVTPRFNQKARELFYASKYHVIGYSLFNTLNELDSVINDHFLSEQILGLIKTYKKSGDLMEVGPFGRELIKAAEASGFRCWKIKSDGWFYDSPIEGREYRADDGRFLVSNRKFDVVTCLDILDRVPNPLRELNGINEILKEDGILLIRVPNFGSGIAEEEGIAWQHNRPWERIYQFDYLHLRNLLGKSGFKIIDVRTELSDGVGSPGCIIIVGMKKIWRIQKKNPRILIMREGAAGDVLLTTPIVKELRRKLPASYVTFMTKYPEILQNNPYVDEVIRFEPQDGVDVVFNLMYELYPDISIIEAYRKITQLSLQYPEIEFYLSRDEQEEIDRLLKTLPIEDTQGIAVIHSMVGNRMKSWDRARYQAVSNHIRSQELRSVTVGSPTDCVELRGAINLIGKLSLRQSAALISKAKLFMGLDSYPMHIADAFKIPSVILFGSTDPRKVLMNGHTVKTVQSSENCLGCRHDTTPDRWKQNVDCRRGRLYCMENISADRVIEEIDEALKISQGD